MINGDGLNPVAYFFMEDMMIRNHNIVLKKEWSFFTNKKGQRDYNRMCLRCKHECKQSFRARVIMCKKYEKK